MRWDNEQPTSAPVEDQTASLPTRQRWNYSPVRLASYTESGREQPAAVTENRGDLQIVGDVQIVPQSVRANSQWKSAQW